MMFIPWIAGYADFLLSFFQVLNLSKGESPLKAYSMPDIKKVVLAVKASRT